MKTLKSKQQHIKQEENKIQYTTPKQWAYHFFSYNRENKNTRSRHQSKERGERGQLLKLSTSGLRNRKGKLSAQEEWGITQFFFLFNIFLYPLSLSNQMRAASDCNNESLVQPKLWGRGTLLSGKWSSGSKKVWPNRIAFFSLSAPRPWRQ